MPVPNRPKIYHIVHVDKLASIIADGRLLSDAKLLKNPKPGTIIGMNKIKERRLHELTLASHPGLYVGQCVPFYFCPRSVMLYLIHMKNPELAYKGGQEPIIHLEADLHDAVQWANANNRRWAFSLSNAGSFYFEDRDDLDDLDEVNWDSVAARKWGGPNISSQVKEQKQAEFLIEGYFPWHLIERIGVHNAAVAPRLGEAMRGAAHRPGVETRLEWYY